MKIGQFFYIVFCEKRVPKIVVGHSLVSLNFEAIFYNNLLLKARLCGEFALEKLYHATTLFVCCIRAVVHAKH